MSSIRSKNTKPELIIFRFLRSRGIYFQKHYRSGVCSIDVAVPRKKLAIFIDGDFWHGRLYAQRSARWTDFWKKKIASNMARDRRSRAMLGRRGWSVLRIWEGALIPGKRREATLTKVEDFLLS